MSTCSDWRELPLASDGRSLVEASAGTGKTWTIGVLYLRLLLEQGLMPHQIVVSTFTRAAAAELSERLRRRLTDALQLTRTEAPATLESDPPSDQVWLHQRWHDNPEQRTADTVRLELALSELDNAPITTLHALCTRILADHPFAAGAPFRNQTLADTNQYTDPLVDDLWRTIAQGEPTDPLVQSARDAGITHSDLGKWVPTALQPDVRVTAFDDVAFQQQFAFLGDLDTWIKNARSLLTNNKYFNASCTLRERWNDVVLALESPREHLRTLRHRTTPTKTLRNAPKLTGISAAGKREPAIEQLAADSVRIADALDTLDYRQLDPIESPALAAFLQHAQSRARTLLVERLANANATTFDAMVTSVRDALAPVAGERALADALFAAWPVALVDEFQDTDPVQFAVLDAIYRNAEGSPRGRLVMIGDPKQAIYRFRGGDVQAYERAKADVPDAARLQLATNYRSTPAFVAASNAFWDAVGYKLGPKSSDTPIAYVPVESADQRKTAAFTNADGKPVRQALVIHRLDDHPDPPRKIPALKTMALRTCADEIAHVLATSAYVIDKTPGKQPLAPSDIAVLLPAHSQIQQLSEMLTARGVPCVVRSSKQKVFHSDVARDLRLVLYAAAHPTEPRPLRAALATRLWGLGFADLVALENEPASWNQLARTFHELHRLWLERGVAAVVNALVDRHAPRLLAATEGERMLTDLRHLGELLQEQADQLDGMQTLLDWLARQVEAAGDGAFADSDADTIRLESDAARVQLLTLHGAKGLEFPVVFLPLMWAHGESPIEQRKPRLLADDHGHGRWLLLDGSPAKPKVQRQTLDERWRVLYVALTRAEYACHLYACAPGAQPSSSNHLTAAPLGLMTERLAPPASREEGAASAIEWRSGWAFHDGVHYTGENDAAQDSRARAMPATPPGPLPMRHSFSTLTHGSHALSASEDHPADDETIEPVDTTVLPSFRRRPESIVSLPQSKMDPGLRRDDEQTSGDISPSAETLPMQTRHAALDALANVAGVDFGNAVHSIFEHRVPGQSLLEQTGLIRSNLLANGVSEDYVEPLAQRLQTVIERLLDAADGPRLGALTAADMQAEMEFNYALDRASMRRLREACEAHGEADLVPRDTRTLAGLMNGKIDLTFRFDDRFHVLDYKGNHLSLGKQTCLEDYRPEAVLAAMNNAHYRFQALLYTVAVERYLRERLPDYDRKTHLGDCWYVFIRAAGLTLPDGTPCGLWHHRFDDALLDAVQRELGFDPTREAA